MHEGNQDLWRSITAVCAVVCLVASGKGIGFLILVYCSWMGNVPMIMMGRMVLSITT